MRRFLLPLFLLACGRPDVPPTIEIRAPTADSEWDGYGNLDVRLAIEDERNDPVEVELFIDGELVGTAQGEKCRRGCQVTGKASTEGFGDGHHILTAAVTDSLGTRTEIPEEEGVLFYVYDIPYVDTLAVHNTQEGALDGPDIEVEVHLQDQESALYLGCAALNEVQEDDLVYEDLAAPFIYNEDGGVRRFMDVAFTPVKVVVIESDAGEHCPAWPALNGLGQTDVDELYGFAQNTDLSVLFNDELVLTNGDFSGLVLKKGRPVNAD